MAFNQNAHLISNTIFLLIATTGTTSVPKRSSFIRQNSTLMSEPPTKARSGDSDIQFKRGDKVCVQLMEVALKDLQRGHGGWSMRMADVCII